MLHALHPSLLNSKDIVEWARATAQKLIQCEVSRKKTLFLKSYFHASSAFCFNNGEQFLWFSQILKDVRFLETCNCNGNDYNGNCPKN
eukprot:3942116-Amphidinium_carterae.1